MQDFLSSFEQRSTLQKTLILLGVTIGLIMLIGLMFFITTPKQTETIPQTTSNRNFVNDKESLPAELNKEPMSEYKGNHFSIIYPTNTYRVAGNKNNNEDNIVLKHDKTSVLPEHSLSIHISASTSALQEIQNTYDSFGYPRESINFQGNNGFRYRGGHELIPGKVGRDNIIAFTKNGLTYRILLFYFSDIEDPSIEKSFEELLTQIKIY